MKVIKEAWVLKENYKGMQNSFLLAQGTSLPKMFISEATAKSGAAYWGKHYNNGTIIHKPVKVYLVTEDEVMQDEIPF
jgi:hypothetical protein